MIYDGVQILFHILKVNLKVSIFHRGPKSYHFFFEKDNDSNRQNILSLPNTETINREFLIEVDSMNERLIPFKSKT